MATGDPGALIAALGSLPGVAAATLLEERGHAGFAWHGDDGIHELSAIDVDLGADAPVPISGDGPVATALRAAGARDVVVERLGPRRRAIVGLSRVAPETIAVVRALAAGARDAERLARLQVLDELLTTLAVSLDVRHAFPEVARIADRVLPHDAMALVTVEPDRRSIRVHAFHGLGAELVPEGPVAIPDPSIVDRIAEFMIVDDLSSDPVERDTRPAQMGMRSSLRVPIRLEEGFLAGLELLSRTAHRYSADDALVARRIADHLALTLSHERVAAAERVRALARERARRLDGLLGTLATTLDLRDVFDRVEAIAQEVLPHDVFTVALVEEGGRELRIHATSTGPAEGLPKLPITPEMVPMLREEVFVVRKIEILDPGPPARVKLTMLGRPGVADRELVIPADPARMRLLVDPGVRSFIRAVVTVKGELGGGVLIGSRRTDAFSHDDVDVVRRIALHLSMALSHHRLHEEEREATEARERASQLESRVARLNRELAAFGRHQAPVGTSSAWNDVLGQAAQVAPTPSTVLLLGESGTGKEVLARFIHHASPRAAGPFVAINCAALPDQLLESELFGYEKGAFTGAMSAKPGQLEGAAGGVLFLDEIGEMGLAAQAKLLRVLQERVFQRLGGTRPIQADARIVAATNRDLRRAIATGAFREDLYYRVQVFEIRIPPLRDRPEDILPLCDAFLAELGASLGRPPAGISRDARERLLSYAWPGNVRELRNALERAAILCSGGLITSAHLALAAPAPAAGAAQRPAQAEAEGEIWAVEKAMVEKALSDARNNKSKAARALGLSRTQLYVRMRRHGIG